MRSINNFLFLPTTPYPIIAVFKILPVVLTLSGAAAIILSLGFAVDANILIFERIREELRSQKPKTTVIVKEIPTPKKNKKR